MTVRSYCMTTNEVGPYTIHPIIHQTKIYRNSNGINGAKLAEQTRSSRVLGVACFRCFGRSGLHRQQGPTQLS